MFREIIQKEAKRQDMSGYRIAQETGIPMRTVQHYLANGSDLGGERVAKIAKVLGLELKRVRRKGQ